jgi:hypothetical protein
MISDALDAAGRRAVEAETGTAAATLSHWCDGGEANGRRMPVPALDLIGRLFPDAALVIARHFAALAGAEVRALPEQGVSIDGAVAEVARAAAEVSARLIEARAPDGPGGTRLTRQEVREIRDDLYRARVALAKAEAAVMRDAQAMDGLRLASGGSA